MDNTVEKALGLIGLAYRARKLEAGEQPVSRALLEKRAKLVLLASDSAENTARRAESWAETANCPVLVLLVTKSRLGAALGREICALAAVTDAGIAKTLQQRLANITHTP